MEIVGLISAIIGLIAALVSRNKTITHKWDDPNIASSWSSSPSKHDQQSTVNNAFLTVVLRLSVVITGIAFWAVAALIPPAHPDQATKGRYLVLFWGSQIVASFVLARRLKRSGILWGLLALITMTSFPIVLAVLPEKAHD